jgi:hypothetical protein
MHAISSAIVAADPEGGPAALVAMVERLTAIARTMARSA